MGTEKLYEYEGYLGRFHYFKDSIRENYNSWRERHPESVAGTLKNYCTKKNRKIDENQDFSHIYRRKTCKELIRVSAAVMGIEFSYAAETAFVSPTLLKIGVEHKHMTLVWALSPLIGFFITPILGSLSDRCNLKFGRRRPFILMMSLGVLLGLVLVPNGEKIGYWLGDPLPPNDTRNVAFHRTTSFNAKSVDSNESNNISAVTIPETEIYNNSHPWGIFFTVLGTALLDFDADACQSPSRAYLLDVTLPEDHARGLSTFTIMAGLGGFFGYALGGINWDSTFIGALFGGHVRAVFTLITIIFIACVCYTITSFAEIPLKILQLDENLDKPVENINLDLCNKSENIVLKINDEQNYGTIEPEGIQENTSQYNTLNEDNEENPENNLGSNIDRKSISSPNATFIVYLKSIIYMPYSIRILCLTNLFCWMAHVCYSLYFTDFVGEAVFNGNPTALDGTFARDLYESGVRFGCWGMSMYSLSCACYSTVIEKLIQKIGAKKIYIGGLLTYSIGMCLMALTKNPVGVILFSATAGVMYSTLFTMPYLLIAHYHAKGTFEINDDGKEKIGHQIRGLGTDVAIVSSMVFLAQFILSICMGSIVNISGTTTAVVSVASILAFFGAISATQVMYLDL